MIKFIKRLIAFLCIEFDFRLPMESMEIWLFKGFDYRKDNVNILYEYFRLIKRHILNSAIHSKNYKDDSQRLKAINTCLSTTFYTKLLTIIYEKELREEVEESYNPKSGIIRKKMSKLANKDNRPSDVTEYPQRGSTTGRSHDFKIAKSETQRKYLENKRKVLKEN